jgi:hypothetical protein
LKDLVVDIGGVATPQGRHIPHVTKVAHAELNAATPTHRFLISPMPTPATGDSDWSGKTFLTFRLGRWHDVSTNTITGNRPRLQVSLRDDKKEETIDQSQFFPVDAPSRPFLHNHHEFDDQNNPLPDKRSTLLRMETVRVDLSLFKKKGIDLKKISDVGFYIDKADNTHIFIDSLELVKL